MNMPKQHKCNLGSESSYQRDLKQEGAAITGGLLFKLIGGWLNANSLVSAASCFLAGDSWESPNAIPTSQGTAGSKLNLTS